MKAQNQTVSTRVAELPKLAMKELWSLWDQYFPRRPSHHNRSYVEGRVAYKIQEEAFGGIKPEVRQQLLRIGESKSRMKVRKTSDIRIVPGTVFMREFDNREHRITTFVPLHFKKRGIKKVIVGPEGVDELVAINPSVFAISPIQDPTLLKALALAHYWGKQIDDGVVTDAGEIARREQMDVTRVREILRLVIIDPQTASAIFEGRQPRTLSLEFLVRKSLPLDWELQRQRVAENGG